MSNTKTGLMKAPSPEVLALLAAQFPVDEGYSSVPLPRIQYVSQDKSEKVKNPKTGKMELKLLVAAGTFFRDAQKMDGDKPVLDEETGKPVWDRTEIGTEIDMQIVFQRKQEKYFDEATNSYVSSNVYDEPEEIIKLFSGKSEIAKGTAAELKKRYEYEDKGKVKSSLETQRVLYVLFEGELHQMNLRGTSMFAWLDYSRKTRPSVPAVITHISSEPRTNGSNSWNCMVFTVGRMANAEEAQAAADAIKDLSDSIADRKARFASGDATDKEFEETAERLGAK